MMLSQFYIDVAPYLVMGSLVVFFLILCFALGRAASYGDEMLERARDREDLEVAQLDESFYA